MTHHKHKKVFWCEVKIDVGKRGLVHGKEYLDFLSAAMSYHLENLDFSFDVLFAGITL